MVPIQRRIPVQISQTHPPQRTPIPPTPGGSDSGGSDTSEPDPNDADGDGFPVEEDCDDTDPWLYPGVSGDPVFDVDRCGQGQRFEGMDTL